MPKKTRSRDALIREIALDYINKGGGLSPSGGGIDIADPIAMVARLFYGGDRIDADMVRQLKDRKAPELEWDVLWPMVNAWASAGFALGVAVGLQTMRPKD